MFASVIIVAAGSSSRMNGIDKQFLTINSKPVLLKSMLAFENCKAINEIIVVSREDNFDKIKSFADNFNITKFKTVISGGETRQQSVFNGINHISEECDIIAIHDGARPLILKSDIEKVIKDANKYGGATLGVPVKDTIKVIDSNGFIKSTPERSKLYITQTPQAFKKDIYLKGIEISKKYKTDFTDDCQLVEAIGIKVFMTIGNYKNIKITTEEDIIIAESLNEEE